MQPAGAAMAPPQPTAMGLHHHPPLPQYPAQQPTHPCMMMSPQMWAPQQQQQPPPQVPPPPPSSSQAEEVRTLWIGDLQYWMDEGYLANSFTTIGEAYGHDMGTPPPAGATFTPHSPWHSPVPYLFGGLAAMLGLIAFALMILACSYWKLSGHFDGSREEDEGDLEVGTGGSKPVAFEEKILVIMAGEMKPTFLATPASSRSSSFSDGKGSCSSTEAGEEPEVKADVTNALKQHEGSDQQSHRSIGASIEPI